MAIKRSGLSENAAAQSLSSPLRKASTGSHRTRGYVPIVDCRDGVKCILSSLTSPHGKINFRINKIINICIQYARLYPIG